ncbi:amidase family protein, partial [Rudaea sp.]|uniref:amidase family protein n=1 Tax=Rudaea sp. TaxID=2136325 RepID=UPI002ED194B9
MNVELSPAATESLAPLPPPGAKCLRGAELCQILHWLASGRISAQALTQTCLDAIAAQNEELNAYIALNPRALDEARASDARRTSGKIGRLDGIPVAVKDNFDVAGLPTGCGLPGAHALAKADAYAV